MSTKTRTAILKNPHFWHVVAIVGGFAMTLAALVGIVIAMSSADRRTDQLARAFGRTQVERNTVRTELASASASLEDLVNQDQYLRNESLSRTIESIEKTYRDTYEVYDDLVALRDDLGEAEELDVQYAKVLSLLAERNYAGASDELGELKKSVVSKRQELAAKAVDLTEKLTAVSDNNPPGNGFRRQRVSADVGSFVVDVVAGDLGSTRVIVDTASDGECHDNCPTLALGEYVGRNGAYAGINGSFFCPATYGSCQGKTNSFDTLLMNKNKVYFNSDNNKFSTVPAVIFGSGWVRFVGQSLEWGRDTGIDSMIANQPLLVSGGNVAFGGSGDPKLGSKSGRSFVANKGNTVYIGVVRSATVAESARVLVAMGMENALNLDSGGSTALWFGGYKAGPGRNIPNAILFVQK